jgi:DNA adenine methylase
MNKIFSEALQEAEKQPATFSSVPKPLLTKVDEICRCESNKAPVRYLLTALGAKIKDPSVNTLCAYPIQGKNHFEGRSIDEHILIQYLEKYSLATNKTTAFLTPSFRFPPNRPYKKEDFVKSRPSSVYNALVDVLTKVNEDSTLAKPLLVATFAKLIFLRDAYALKLALQKSAAMLSKEPTITEIIEILETHAAQPRASRLPVLMYAAAHDIFLDGSSYTRKKLLAHNAADKQTGATGDIEIIEKLTGRLITSIEIKSRAITEEDVNIGVEKALVHLPVAYFFASTVAPTDRISKYAESFSGKVQFRVWDIFEFIASVLCMWPERRSEFLEDYKKLVLEDADVDNSLRLFLLEQLSRLAKKKKGN